MKNNEQTLEAGPASRGEPLGFTLKDFGPIDEAWIVPRPLTVLVGPSGAGKTFAATAMYGFAQAGRELLDATRGPSGFVGLNEAVHAELGELVAELRVLLPDLPRGARPAPGLEAWLMKVTEVAIRHLLTLAQKNCELLLDGDRAALSRRDGPGVRVAFGVGHGGGPDALGWSMDGGVVSSGVLSDFGRGFVNELMQSWAVSNAEPWSEERWRMAVASPFVNYANALQRHFGPAPLYLPAGRTGLLAVSHMVTMAALTEGLKARGPIAVFLPDLVRAGRASDGALAPVVDDIEAALHGGRIGVSSGPSPVPRLQLEGPDGLAVPMERASASVSELAAVTFIVRRLARPGSMVVIEEPEAHLHPSKLLVLASALARLVRAGVRPVITTHSDLLVRKLGALVMKTALADRAAPDRQATGDDLRAEEVAVYRFEEGARGYVAVKEPVNAEMGLNTDELAAADEELYRERRSLRERLGNLRD